MRALSLVAFGVFVVACGKAETPDAGTPMDSGVIGTQDAGFDAGPPPVCLPNVVDAGPPSDGGLDFSCRGSTPIHGGQGELVVTGMATKAGFVRTPLANVVLDLVLFDGTVLASALSGDGGTYLLRYDAGCAPLEAEVRATHPPDDAGFALSYSVPNGPFRYDRANLELVMFDQSTQGLAAAIASVTLVPGAAVLALTVEDCVGNSVEGAVVSTVGGVGDVRYVGASGLPTNMLSATSASGDVVIFNLPGSSVEVLATFDGGVIAQRVIPIHADSATGTFLSP
jgi:hypothetical protein